MLNKWRFTCQRFPTGCCPAQVVADYLMIVDASQGVLEGSAGAAPGQAAHRKAPRERGPKGIDAAQQALRLYNEGHSLPTIAQMLVGSSPALPLFC